MKSDTVFHRIPSNEKESPCLKRAFQQIIVLTQHDDERLRLEAQRGGLELPGLQSHDVPWPQERALLQQELRLFRRNTIIFYMKLRSILMHWRLGHKDSLSEENQGHQEVSSGQLISVSGQHHSA